MPTVEEARDQLMRWKEQGKTTGIISGRFQPLHKGHIALIRTAMESGLDIHILINGINDTPNGKNPYSGEQRLAMIERAFPDLPRGNIHVRSLEASAWKADGDLESILKGFTREVSQIADPRKCVIFYTHKKEDEGHHMLRGKRHENVKWLQLLGEPHGPFAVQSIPLELSGVPDIDATSFRKKRSLALLHPAVAEYLLDEEDLACVNKRKVGGDKAGDIPYEHAAATESPDPSLSLGQHQLRMLARGKRILVRAE